MTGPRALIADDERLMREQLRARLAEVWPELQIVAEARHGAEAVELTGREHPDIVFLDIFPFTSGLGLSSMSSRSTISSRSLTEDFRSSISSRDCISAVLRAATSDRNTSISADISFTRATNRDSESSWNGAGGEVALGGG